MAGTVDPVLDDLQSEAETKVSVDDVAIAQDAALARDGQYEQVINKPEAVPSNEGDGAVHVYLSPKGPGYVIEWYAKKGDEVWRKALNAGPEEHRSHDWQLTPANVWVTHGFN